MLTGKLIYIRKDTIMQKYEPHIHISAVDTDSTNGEEYVEVYVERTDIPNPYKIEELVNIDATDYTGTKNLSNRVNIQLYDLNYKKIGVYPIAVSVMDDDGNLALSTFVIHVVQPETSNSTSKISQLLNNISNAKVISQILSWSITIMVIGFIFYFFYSMFF